MNHLLVRHEKFRLLTENWGQKNSNFWYPTVIANFSEGEKKNLNSNF